MTVPNILLIKVPSSKVVLRLRENFGTHLLPVFYSGSIDLVMQNLFIVIVGKLMEFGKMNMKLMSSKRKFITMTNILKEEFSGISEIIKALNTTRQPDSSMMMLKITTQGMVQVYTSSIYQALYKISKSKGSTRLLETENLSAKEVA
ncbi:MAG: hypothetical protein WC716_14725 [Chitinophagaceae bacterium]|jgi:hypothetical protein